MDREMFCGWLLVGQQQDDASYPCATAVMQYALDKQGMDMRGGVTGDTAWELCGRVLSMADGFRSICSRDAAQLLVYWADNGDISHVLRDTLYLNMEAELRERGKEFQTEGDEAAMKVRWVKQQLHRELELTKIAFPSQVGDLAIELEIDGEMVEGEQPSITKESELEASKILKSISAVISPEVSDERKPNFEPGIDFFGYYEEK
jgi:hypothetical protein